MLSDDTQAREMWDGLIETIGMAQYVEQLNPVLESQFGTYLSAQILAAYMCAALSEWMANPQDFRSLVEQKYRESSSPPSHRDKPLRVGFPAAFWAGLSAPVGLAGPGLRR